ncbi:MAG TPA: methyltransferase domain-containing protein [Polyangia bacterium]|jgi:2-polyprenyl-3-methyl-5-hydroxy-6-metoxy-1,4-benzoquinol methylase
MQAQGYRVTLEHQAVHWWYRSRRELWLRQVDRAARALARPARAGAERPLTLLDYGCAAGFDLPALARFGAVHGADILDPGQIDALAEPGREVDRGEAFPAAASPAAASPAAAFPIHRLPDDLPALRGRFDIVTCLDVLEHLDDDVAGLRAIAGLLSPGGQVVVTVPAYDWLWSGEDVISAHRRRYTRARLLGAARAAGFEALFASYFFASVLPGMAAVVWGRRLVSERWRSQTNLDAHPGWLDGVLRAVTGAEARLVGDERLSLPAGASLVCRLRLPERS